MTPIIGIRYKCVICKDFDFCASCESINVHPHPMIKLYKDGQCPSMMIVAIDNVEEPFASAPVIRTGSGISALSAALTSNSDQIPCSTICKPSVTSTTAEAVLAIKLFDKMKLGKSFEECMRIARTHQCDETAAIKHLCEKHQE